jgi:hypothetical protein
MAKRPIPRSTNSVPTSAPAEAAFDPLEVDGAPSPGDETIVVNATNGQVTRLNDDGSMTIVDSAKPKPRGAQTFDDNLADDEGMGALLPMIAQRLLDGIEADMQSRRDWEETAQKGADYLGIRLEEASSDVSSQSTVSRVHHTGLLKSVMKSWATSRAELLPVGGPVKVRDDATTGDELPGDPDNQIGRPAGQRNELADALEKDMNHYLTVVDKDYYPDFSRMLFSRALLGCQFRKIYRDPLLRRPVSRWTKGTDLIISNDATHLSGAGRITERIKMSQAMVRRLQKNKHWRDIELTQPTPQATSMDQKIGEVEGVRPIPTLPEDMPHTIYECYCELEAGRLKENETGHVPGYPLPYRVTIDKDSRVILEIRRNWKQGDEEYIARRRYVKYPFVPGLGFYDYGYIHLIGNPQRAATAIERQLIDAGSFASFPGGIMRKSAGTRQRTTEIRPGVGEFVVMDTGDGPISDSVMPWPYKEPSATLAAMGQDLAGQIDSIAGTMEVPMSEGREVPVATMMAYVDAISRVPSAIHKDDHMAQQEEYELLKELFEEDPEALSKFSKRPSRKWQIAQEIADQDLVPGSDPNIPSQIHRIMQTQALIQMAQLPIFQGIANPRALWDMATRTLGVQDNATITSPPAPPQQAPPDPKMIAEMAKAKQAQQDGQIKIAEIQAQGQQKQQQQAIESADREADRQSEDARSEMEQQTEALKAKAQIITHIGSLAQKHQQHTDEMAGDDADRQQQAISNGMGIVGQAPASDGE